MSNERSRTTALWSWVDAPADQRPAAKGRGRYSRPWSVRDTLVVKTVGSEVRRLRQQEGLTVYELAERLGVSQPYVTQIEMEARDIGMPMLFDLADIFHVAPEHFVQVAKAAALARSRSGFNRLARSLMASSCGAISSPDLRRADWRACFLASCAAVIWVSSAAIAVSTAATAGSSAVIARNSVRWALSSSTRRFQNKFCLRI